MTQAAVYNTLDHNTPDQPVVLHHIATCLSLRPMAIFEGQLGHNSIYL